MPLLLNILKLLAPLFVHELIQRFGPENEKECKCDCHKQEKANDSEAQK